MKKFDRKYERNMFFAGLFIKLNYSIVWVIYPY